VRVDRIRAEPEAIKSGVDDVRSRVKEDLFHILDDNDGSKFREWLQVFTEDRPAFFVKAAAWANLCCEIVE